MSEGVFLPYGAGFSHQRQPEAGVCRQGCRFVAQEWHFAPQFLQFVGASGAWKEKL
jgi:hypothetical protein